MLQNILALEPMNVSAKTLFLIDGLGALLSAFFLGVVLVRFEEWFGMPAKVLYVLAGLALVYAAYSLACHFLLSAGWSPYLKIIAAANVFHCVLTGGLLIVHRAGLTGLDWAYFGLEMVIVLGLAGVEWRVANRAI